MSNFRSRELLNLAYELDCTLRIEAVCTGGTGEPCHANWGEWGKGGAMKAHDFAFASGCRACHMALDQGSKLAEAARQFYWMRGHVETMRQLWERGLVCVRSRAHVPPELERARRENAPQPSMVICVGNGPAHSLVEERAAKRRKKSRCTASSKTVPRPAGWAR